MNKQKYFNREAAESLLPDHSGLIPAEQNVFDDARNQPIAEAFDDAEARYNDYQAEREYIKGLAKQRYKAKKAEQAITQEQFLRSKNPIAIKGYQKYEQSKAITPEVIESQEAAGMSAKGSKLFRALGINLSMVFSKQDTYDLISSLLTCNESQLEALISNKRVPISVKTIVKVILEDYKNGSMCTVDKLWTRLFGSSFEKEQKAAASQATVNILSILPGVDGSKPISREGYALIRDKIFGAEG